MFSNQIVKPLIVPQRYSVVYYALSCSSRPPSKPGCPPCPPHSPGQRITQPPDCYPGVVPPNPCVPRFHHGKDTWKKYKYIALFGGIPLILLHGFNCFCGHHHVDVEACRDYEYMRRRTKRFPWGDGQKSLFHNDNVNWLPGECDEGPFDCDDD